MKYSALLAGFCLTGALASPMHKHEKRVYVTDVTVVTRTVYVPAGSDPTPTAAAPGGAMEAVENNAPVAPRPGSANSPKPPPDSPPPAPKPKPDPKPKPPPKQPEPKPDPKPNPPKQPEPKPDPKPEPPPVNDYQALVLHHHNIHRANHSAPALVWDKGLENSARELAESCVYGHNTDIGGGGYGQNIGYGIGIDHLITNSMYNGEFMKYQALYGVASPQNLVDWGHLTQIVWKKTKKVGCYTHTCAQLQDPNHGEPISDVKHSVCNYDPPGNWAGEYDQNVGKPLGHPIVVV